MKNKMSMRTSMAALLGAVIGVGGVTAAHAGGGPGEYGQGQQSMRQGRMAPMGMRQIDEKSRQVRGRIQALKLVEVRGMDQPNVVALIRSRKGNQQLVVDLGPRNRLRSVTLQRGGQISVEGKLARVQDRSILVADRARIQGRTIRIQRPQQRSQYVENLRAMSPAERRALQRKQRQASGMCPMEGQMGRQMGSRMGPMGGSAGG